MTDSAELVVDTREHVAGSCASVTNNALDSIPVGDSFVLIADHDPRGLHYMLDAERPGAVRWETLEDGPQLWQVRVSKLG